MEENTEVVKAQPDYEKLEREVTGLRSMNNQLIMQLQQMNMANLFKRLDYLFKVVELREAFNPEFITRCTREIEGHLTPSEVPDEPANDN